MGSRLIPPASIFAILSRSFGHGLEASHGARPTAFATAWLRWRGMARRARWSWDGKAHRAKARAKAFLKGRAFPQARQLIAVEKGPERAWAAAHDPHRAYREDPRAGIGFWMLNASPNGPFGLNILVGAAGSGKSIMLRKPSSKHRIDALLEQTQAGWTIAADEPVGPSHPLSALAFLNRASEIESQGSEAERGRVARSLARSMAGIDDPDGLHPDWAQGIEDSMWAPMRAEKILAAALPLSRAMREARSLSSAVERLGSNPAASTPIRRRL